MPELSTRMMHRRNYQARKFALETLSGRPIPSCSRASGYYPCQRSAPGYRAVVKIQTALFPQRRATRRAVRPRFAYITAISAVLQEVMRRRTRYPSFHGHRYAKFLCCSETRGKVGASEKERADRIDRSKSLNCKLVTGHRVLYPFIRQLRSSYRSFVRVK